MVSFLGLGGAVAVVVLLLLIVALWLAPLLIAHALYKNARAIRDLGTIHGRANGLQTTAANRHAPATDESPGPSRRPPVPLTAKESLQALFFVVGAVVLGLFLLFVLPTWI